MRLGVIDVGSNTVHLLVVDAHTGAQPLPASSHKRELRLSEHVTDSGDIDDSGRDQLAEFVAECLTVAEDQGVEDLMGFVTSAIREAPNGDDVLAHVKDRTGVVAALLLLSLGVDRETVLDDYVATSRYRTIVHQQDSLANMLAAGVAPEAAAGVLGVPRWAMAEAIDAVERDHGGIDAYLSERAGLSPAVLERLRAIHVGPAGSARHADRS